MTVGSNKFELINRRRFVPLTVHKYVMTIKLRVFHLLIITSEKEQIIDN